MAEQRLTSDSPTKVGVQAGCSWSVVPTVLPGRVRAHRPPAVTGRSPAGWATTPARDSALARWGAPAILGSAGTSTTTTTTNSPQPVSTRQDTSSAALLWAVCPATGHAGRPRCWARAAAKATRSAVDLARAPEASHPVCQLPTTATATRTISTAKVRLLPPRCAAAAPNGRSLPARSTADRPTRDDGQAAPRARKPAVQWPAFPVTGAGLPWGIPRWRSPRPARDGPNSPGR